MPGLGRKQQRSLTVFDTKIRDLFNLKQLNNIQRESLLKAIFVT